MKISDLLQESQQLDELSAADIGKGVGKVAKGIGAVAGGIAGIPGAVKKGFQAGKQTVSGAGDTTQAPAQTTTPADQTKPATQQAAQTPAQTTTPANQTNQGGQGGQTKPATQQAVQTPAEPEEKPAAPAKPEAEPAQSGGDVTAAKDVAAVKKELETFLQTYKSDVAMQNKNWQTVMPRLDTLEKQVADLTTAKSQPADQPAAAPSQAEIDADRARLGVGGSESVTRTGKSITEGLQLFRR